MIIFMKSVIIGFRLLYGSNLGYLRLLIRKRLRSGKLIYFLLFYFYIKNNDIKFYLFI